MFPLIFVALLAQLGSVPPPGPCQDVENLRRQELRLLHFPIDRDILKDLRVWDSKTEKVRARRPAENPDDSTPVIIVHLWATWCEPCKEEFPLWRTLAAELNPKYKGRVRIYHIAILSPEDKIAEFVKQIGDKFPHGAKYFDHDEKLAKNIRRALNAKRNPSLPLTLWLDSERVVRQVLIGPIGDRLPEVRDSTARLMSLITHLEDEALKPKTKEEDDDVFSSPK